MIYSSWDIQQNIIKLVILGHFLPFYLHKNLRNQNFKKWKILLEISFYICAPKFTIIWCMVPEIWSETGRIFFSFAAIFCPFSPLPYPGDIIILQICTINNNHVMYGSWGMQCNRHDYLSFWTIFCPFTSLWT